MTIDTTDQAKRMIPVEALRRPVAYHRVFRDITESVGAAVLLSQFWYWNGEDQDGKPRISDDREGWFYKTGKDIYAETGMSRTEQQTARKRLVAAGIMEEVLSGVPAKMYFRLDIDRIVELINATYQFAESPQTGADQFAESPQTGLRNPRKQGSRDSANKEAESPQTITESTAETTREYDRDSAADATPPPTPDPVQSFVLELIQTADHSRDQTPQPDPAPPGRTYSADQIAYGMVDAYYRAMGTDPAAIPKVTKVKAQRVFKGVVGQYEIDDIRECAGYLWSDPWWKTVSSTGPTPSKVVDALPVWASRGRPLEKLPEPVARTGRADGTMSGNDWREMGRQMAEREARGGG